MKQYKDVCAVTEAAFPLPDTLMTLRPVRPRAVQLGDLKISALFSAKLANTLCASSALLTNF